MENMVYGHAKCFKGWISTINGVLLRKEKFTSVSWVMIITQKIAKKDKNVEYIQYCGMDHHKLLHFQKKDDSTKRSGDGTSGQDGPRSNQINQEDGSGDQTLSTAGLNLTTHDSHFTILVEVFTSHILAKGTYFTNHKE